MISPHTPAGTHVVFIGLRDAPEALRAVHAPAPIALGSVHVLETIEPCRGLWNTPSGFFARLAGQKTCFCLHTLDPAGLQ
ncbi:MAG: hypothetical protein QM651_02175, partial [Rhodoblastus sp.]